MGIEILRKAAARATSITPTVVILPADFDEKFIALAEKENKEDKTFKDKDLQKSDVYK